MRNNHNHNNECSSALSTTVMPIVHYSVTVSVGKQVSLEGFTKNLDRVMFLMWGGMRFQIFSLQIVYSIADY